MKKIAVLLLAGAAALSLAACGGSGSSASSKSTSSASTVEGSTKASSGTSVSGKAYDTGTFKVTVPDGWMVVEQMDMTAEADEDGNYPTDPNYLGLIKGGESEWDAFSKPTVYIWIWEDYEMEQYADDATSWYDERSEIDVKVGDKKVVAYETKSSYDEDDDPYIYDIVYIQLDDTHFAQVSVPIDMVEFEGVNVTDDDVMTIMETITLD